ncbi:restriction endonuclease subunit S [Staphylococcus schweitzeri]|uniref:restriction endonuclease subunit S n=1 Tax=Staphylococcus schweitzeri TaxID=1654388 RepID=UPI00050815E1|nr:restriction endonuclease subunit S [Staphylococcus schweitzeri]CDR22282.1 type I restriction-modification system S subunit [Staphylococcus schweitzeri]
MSNTQKKNVPELRFPGFEGAWEEKTISSFLKESKIKGSNGSHAKKLTVKLWGKGVVPKKETFKGSDNTQYYKRKAGQLMYGKLDFLNCAFGIVPDSLNNYESTIDSPSFDFINGDSKFLLERIKLKSFYKKFGDIANGSRKAKRINQDTFLSLPVFAPKYDEQVRIGNFFSKLDQQIELEEQKLELLQQQKKGYMQKIFSQELRFKDENGKDYPEWEEKKLGEVASFAKGKLGAKKDVSQTGVPIILYGELYTKYGAIVSKIFSKTDIPENKLKMASKNDVLIPSSGETAIDIATASCIYLNKGVAVGGDINILTPQKQDGRFISLSINGINKNELSKYAQGKTIVHLYNNDIKNLKIAFPRQFEEQQKIGDLFSKLDRQIELEQQKLELLQQQKKALLKSMFI